jgi:hypothetical protein
MTARCRRTDSCHLERKKLADLPNFEALDTQLRELAIGCCEPIFWFETESRKVIANGTVTFVASAPEPIMVTAAHVVRGYQAAVKEKKGVALQIGDVPVTDIEKYLIAISDKLDIATFDARFFLEIKGARKKSPLTFKSADRLSKLDPVMLGGFPGKRRYEEGDQELIFGPFYSLGGIQSKSPTEVTWRIEREYLVPHEFIPQVPENYDLGGISGGPFIGCFDSGGLVNFAICAIISEASPAFEYVVARRTDFIQPDGSLVEPNHLF